MQWPLLLPYSNYRNQLTDEKLIRVSGIAEVEGTGRSTLVLKDISLEPPHLTIEVKPLDRDGTQGPADSPNPGAVSTSANKTQSLPQHQWSMVWSFVLCPKCRAEHGVFPEEVTLNRGCSWNGGCRKTLYRDMRWRWRHFK